MDFEYLGPYRIEGILGRGGMGTVYKGSHAKTNEPVAIKVIASVLADQERFRRRFAAEVETLKRLSHPNIVQLIGYGEEQGHLFYSMEYVSGESLQQELRRHKKLPWKRVIDICIEICGALKQAHDLGIIHRDLKPANIMINEEGQIKLTDFGIAKLFGSTDVTVAGAVIGTADFMPPEQAEGKGVTSRSDLYAVGSLAYACLAGRAPFTGKSVPEVLYAVRYNTPTPIASLAEIPDEFAELIEELLKKDPAQRPPTALVVSNRLKALKMGLQRREELTSSSQILEKAATASELTSIDLDDLKEADPKLRDLGGPTHNDETLVAPPSVAQPAARPTFSRPTKPPMAGPEESTRVASPSALESDFESDELGSERVVGQTHFTIVEEDDRRRASQLVTHAEDKNDWVHWISIGALVVALVGCVYAIFHFTRPSSSDSLHAQIQTALESGDDSQLLDLESVIEELETRYPDDPKLKEYEPLKFDIELLRSTKSLQRKARMEGSALQLDPIEQAFLDCVQARAINDSEALTKIDAMLAVFSEPKGLSRKQQKLIELAAHMKEQVLKAPSDRTHPAAEMLQDQMRWASVELPKELQVRFYKGIIELYQDKPWAKDMVLKAKMSLEAAEKN